MSNGETKTAPKAENQTEVQELQTDVRELTVAAAEQVRGGQASRLSLNFSKIEF